MGPSWCLSTILGTSEQLLNSILNSGRQVCHFPLVQAETEGAVDGGLARFAQPEGAGVKI